MGEMRVPEDALYGAQTARAVENFPISGRRCPREFLRALGLIKAAAARVNGRLRRSAGGTARRRSSARRTEVAEGQHDAHFPVDVFQTGSGTSTNMNANEVIGRLAGAHPNDRGESRAIEQRRVSHGDACGGGGGGARDGCCPRWSGCGESLERKAAEFADVLKIGRTHLQDAVPMRMGQEFCGYARQVELAASGCASAVAGLYELPLGGTAVGTGLERAGRDSRREVIAESARSARGCRSWRRANHFEAQAARDAVLPPERRAARRTRWR